MTHRPRLLAAFAAVGLFGTPALLLAQSSPPGSAQPGPPGSAQPGPPGHAPAARPLPSDGTAGNPPSTATQRGADAVTGNRTPPDGTPGNPSGTAAGRTVDRALGTNPPSATPARSAGMSSAAMAVDGGALRGGKRASKVIGSPVYNENNESIGEVDDILIPTGSSAPVAVISVGGFLGIGAKLVAVPYDRLQAASGNATRWTLTGATKDSLGSLPTFTYDGQAERKG